MEEGGPVIDLLERMLAANESFASHYREPESPRPRRGLAVVTCMDARVDPLPALGLDPGDAHVVRNAGGIVTDDVIRSLCLSQRLLGTGAIVVIQHTDCGLEGVSDEDFASLLVDETGQVPPWRAGGFEGVDAAVRSSMERVARSPYLPLREHVAGFVYHTDTGRLRRIHPAP